MKRSEYTFQLNCDPKMADNLVQNYLQAKGYKLQQKNGEKFYRAGDAMVGYHYFDYQISGQTLVIYAWLKDVLNHTHPLEQKNILNVVANEYRDSLGTLFQEIDKLNNQGGGVDNTNANQSLNQGGGSQTNLNPNMGPAPTPAPASAPTPVATPAPVSASNPNPAQPVGQNVMSQPSLANASQPVQAFQDETNKKKETMCEVGFWMSIVGLVASFFGVMYGVLVDVFIFYFAAQGLKTRKKGKAIATIVMSVTAIVVTVVKLVIQVNNA